MSQTKRIDEIKKRCKENELNIYDVFRQAKVPNMTLPNWEKGDPKPFKTLDKINTAIDEMIAAKTEEPEPTAAQ